MKFFCGVGSDIPSITNNNEKKEKRRLFFYIAENESSITEYEIIDSTHSNKLNEIALEFSFAWASKVLCLSLQPIPATTTISTWCPFFPCWILLSDHVNGYNAPHRDVDV